MNSRYERTRYSWICLKFPVGVCNTCVDSPRVAFSAFGAAIKTSNLRVFSAFRAASPFFGAK
jgi:hypothetical protein